MKEPLVQEAVAALRATSSDVRYEPIRNGLINHSYCVTDCNDRRVFLQQINNRVFLQPRQITDNLNTIYTALKAQHEAHRMARPLRFENDAWLFCDSNGQYWRAAEFIKGNTFHSTSDLQLLKHGVQGYASFTALLSDLPTGLLFSTLENFHDLSLRFAQFEQATQQGDPTRLKETGPLIEALLDRTSYVQLYCQINESPDQFKKRVMHHDAKLSNLLFDRTGQHVVAITDLDTTMPGYFFSDLGDMVRSMAASAEENSQHPQDVVVLPSAYETIYSSYHSIIKDQLTATEEGLLHAAGLLMIYMQALRFLTDYLQGDRYYQILRPEHNRQRAEHQFALLSSLEELLRKNYRFIIY
jgi:thiamine kinase-like enzyme